MRTPGSTGPGRVSRWRPAAVAAALALVLAGCTGSPPETPRTPAPSAGSPTATSAPTPGPTPGPTTGPTTGPTSGPDGPAAAVTGLGAKWDWGRFEQYEPFLESISGGPTFFEAVWCDVEAQEGERDWSTVDDVVERSSQVGSTVMLKIRVGRCWATPGQAQQVRGDRVRTESTTPTDTGAYRHFVTAVVERYGPLGVDQYAVENEVNSPSYWDGSAQEYADLVEVASEAVRAADPAAEVLDSGISSVAHGYGVADRLLADGQEQAAVDAWNAYYENRVGTRGDSIPTIADAAGLQAVLASEPARRSLEHLQVVADLAEAGVVDVRQVHYYEPSASVGLLFDYLRATTPAGTPVEAWEVGSFDPGASAGGERDAEALRTVALVLAEGARVAVWLPLAFNPTGRNPGEPRFGLLDPDGTSRPAADAYRELAVAARGRVAVPVAGGGLAGVGFDDDAGGATAVVWSEQSAPVGLPPGSAVADDAGPGGEVVVEAEPQVLDLGTDVGTFLAAQPDQPRPAPTGSATDSPAQEPG